MLKVRATDDSGNIESSPAGAGVCAEAEWLTGPAMNAGGRSDVVANQAQVDDLLGSLGF